VLWLLLTTIWPFTREIIIFFQIKINMNRKLYLRENSSVHMNSWMCTFNWWSSVVWYSNRQFDAVSYHVYSVSYPVNQVALSSSWWNKDSCIILSIQMQLSKMMTVCNYISSYFNGRFFFRLRLYGISMLYSVCWCTIIKKTGCVLAYFKAAFWIYTST